MPYDPHPRTLAAPCIGARVTCGGLGADAQRACGSRRSLDPQLDHEDDDGRSAFAALGKVL